MEKKGLELIVYDLDKPMASFLPQKGETLENSPRYAHETYNLEGEMGYTIGRPSRTSNPMISLGNNKYLSRKQGEIRADKDYEGTAIYTNLGQIVPRLDSKARLVKERQERLGLGQPVRLYRGDSLNYLDIAKIQLN